MVEQRIFLKLPPAGQFMHTIQPNLCGGFGSTPKLHENYLSGQLRVTPPPVKPWVAGSNPACSAKIGAVNVKITKMVNLHLLHWKCWFESGLPHKQFINEVKLVLLLNWKKN